MNGVAPSAFKSAIMDFPRPPLTQPPAPEELRSRTETIPNDPYASLPQITPIDDYQRPQEGYDNIPYEKPLNVNPIIQNLQKILKSEPEDITLYRGEGGKNEFSGKSTWIGGKNFATDKTRAEEFGSAKEFKLSKDANILKIDTRGKELSALADELGVSENDMLSSNRLKEKLSEMGYDAIQTTDYLPSSNKSVTDFIVLNESKLSTKPQAKQGGGGSSSGSGESLWHETNQLQLGTTNSDVTGLNVATDRDLALGQSGKGVLIEFNKSKLLGSAGQLQAIRKAANDVFGIKEFRVLGGRGDPSAVKSITISPTAQIPKEDMIRAKRLFPNIQKLEDGTIILTKKDS